MTLWARKLWLLLVSWVVPASKTVSAEPRRQRQPRRREIPNDLDGKWYFRKDILDRLDQYFNYIGLMKKADPESYVLYSRIGASITAAQKLYIGKDLPPRWNVTHARPGFGALAFMFANDDKDFGLKFLSFRKMTALPPKVQRLVGADNYQVVMIYEFSPGKPFALSFYVAIISGEVTLLKERVIVQQARRNSHLTIILRREWKIPEIPAGAEYEGLTDLERARGIFMLAIDSYENANSGLRVDVARGRRHAAFNVDLLRTPYFFKDRAFVPTTDGRRLRIFHIVRTHKRRARGKESYVRSHFRGTRRFDWNGYRVNVSMPGYHHADMMQATMGAHSFEDEAAMPRGWIANGELGKRLEKILAT